MELICQVDQLLGYNLSDGRLRYILGIHRLAGNYDQTKKGIELELFGRASGRAPAY